MTKLLLATNNKGKIHEFRSLLTGIPYELVTPVEVGVKLEVDESGGSYEENARLKSLAFHRASGLITLADDSGLEVDALNGEPGIRSSRFAGEAASDTDKVHYLLSLLKDVPLEKRTAHFVSVIAITLPDGKMKIRSGKCYGIITEEPRGNLGFGYDPIFYFPELHKTMAELPMNIKNRVSHRALAAKEACKILKKLDKPG
jgi:XTP/dITP diphosphohydrolase